MRISSVLTSQATTPHTRDAWSVMREAWCVLHDSTCTSKSDAWCVKVIFADGATQCGSPGAYFIHRDMAPIYLNINVSTAIASAILSQMFPIRMLSLYSFNKVLYSAGCSSTRLVNFSRYLSSITSLYINHHKSSTNDYVMYKWVSTWLSVDHMQGSWGCPGESIKWRHGRLAWCVLTAPRAVNTRAQNEYASRMTCMWSRSFYF